MDAAARAPVVEIRHLEKHYVRGGQIVPVLTDISLDIAAGEFMALMGPSGSGKSTLLNLIAGIDKPTAGSLKVDGVEIAALDEGELADWRARNIGFIFQFYNLMPMLSAAANVELPLLLTNLSKAERKRHVAIALDMVGLSERAAHKPGELSGGQQQRVGIARAIVTDPAILLCDEPTGDLDRATAEEILTLLTELNKKQGKTIVMVTHDPKAADYATRHVDVDKGQLILRRAA